MSRYLVLAVVLALVMLAGVLFVQPSWQTLILCFIAWFGGVACALAADAYGRSRR